MAIDTPIPATDVERDPVEQLAEQFLTRRRKGEPVSVEHYAQGHPEVADRIRELFPTLLLVEDLKPKAPGGPADAGARGQQVGLGTIERLGDFRIVREIGRGGMGVVYEAEQESLGRRVALKVLPGLCTTSPNRLQRFLREAQAAARLHHTNIVPVFGVGQQEGVHYYIMQLIAGEGLDRVLAELSLAGLTPPPAPSGSGGSTTVADETDGPRPVTASARLLMACPPVAGSGDRGPGKAGDGARGGLGVASGPEGPYWRCVAGIGVQVAHALEYAHRQGTLHRDIKPGNLLLDAQGTVWITDFGLAKLADLDDLTQTGDTVGTVRYMAPEQFLGQADARSDLYSLGLTLYEMLTLRPAFEEADRRRLLPQLAQEDPPRPRQFNPAIPRDLETIVLKAIARGPEHRYRSAGELAADLERFLENRPIHARPVPGYVRAWRWCRRNRAVAALGATAAILLVTVALGASVGYVQRTRALRTEAQLREEAESARHRAEANLGLAAQAFEEVFDRVAGLPIPEAPGDNDADNDLPGDSSTLPVVGARDAAILERLLAFYDQFAEQNQDSARWQQETARAFRRVGEIHLRLGRHPEAESACRRALALYDVLLKNPDVAADCLAGTAATYNLLGLVAMEDGRPAVALERFRRARQTLLSRPEILDASAVCRTELARACNRSALAALVQPPPPPWAKARPGSADTPPGELLRQAIQIAQSLLKETPHQPEYLLTLAESYRHLWGVEARSGHRKQAAQAREEAIRILEATMTEHADNADCRAALVETYLLPFRFADPRSPPTDPDRHMDRALGTAEDLVGRYPQVPKYKSLLAQAHFTAAQIAAWKGQGEQADKHCQQAVATQKELLEQAPSAARYQFDLIRYLDERIRICRDAGRTTALAAALKDQIDVLERRPTGMQDSPWVRGRLIRSHDELAGILKQQGDTAGAERAYAKAKLLRDGPASGKKALMTP